MVTGDVPEQEKIKAFRLYAMLVGSLDTLSGLGIDPLDSARLHGALWRQFQERWWVEDYYEWRGRNPVI